MYAVSFFTDEEGDDDAHAEHCDKCADAITNDCVELACRGAAELHRKGLVTRLFGRTIPIIVHELEYDEEIADQTKRANPPGVADEFAEWVMSM